MRRREFIAGLGRRSVNDLTYEQGIIDAIGYLEATVSGGDFLTDQNQIRPITTPIWWTAQPPAMPRVRAQAS
jgi:hypothetical protein